MSPGTEPSPRSASASRSTSALRCSFSTLRGCSRTSSSAAIAPATDGGAGAVEKMNVRAVFTRNWDIDLEQHT